RCRPGIFGEEERPGAHPPPGLAPTLLFTLSGPERPRFVIQGEKHEMTKFALLLSLIFVAGIASAQEPAKPAAPAKPAHHANAATKASAVKTHDVTTEVVSI